MRPSVFDEYVLTSWTDENGPFGGWIVGIGQDPHGYLWVATVSELIRFDGDHFERFQPSDGTRLPQRSISSLYVAHDGSVWVGFSGGGGICRIQEQHVKLYETSDGLSGRRVTGFVEDEFGRILATTQDGLFRFVNDRWERMTVAHGVPDGLAYTAYQDRAGALWIGTSNGILRRDAGQQSFHPIDRSLRYSPSFSESTNGTMWITDPLRGFRKLGLWDRRTRSSPDRLEGNGYKLLNDRFGNLWVATLGQGLWFVRDGDNVHVTPEVIGTHNGLSNDAVRCVFEDRNGDIWVGTTVGLHRFARRRVTPITDLGFVHAVEVGPDGDVWVGTAGGLVRFIHGERHWYGPKDGLPGSDVRALHLDNSGVLWIATTAGVAVFTDGRLSPLPLVGREWPARIIAIATAPSGTLWITDSEDGLLRWRDGQLAPFDPLPEINHTMIELVASDSHDRLWLLITGGGIALLDHGAFRLLRPGDKFHRTDLAVYEDSSGAMWFGGGDRLTRFKDDTLVAISRANGFPADAIRALTDDADGHLWIGTSGGIVRLPPDAFDNLAAHSDHGLDFRFYDSSDGLAGMPFRSGYRNAIRGRDGQLWFVTGNGLTVIDPRRLSVSRPAPSVRIERVTANGRSFEPAALVELPPRTTSLQIEYTAPTLFSPRHVQFRYRLDGFDDDWTDAGTRRQALYTNLPPRRYRFRVIARSSEGIWNEHGDAIEFSILPMFYQTRWFYTSCAIAAMMMLLTGWRLRLQQVRRQFALVLTERARMAREIHDTLLQSLAGLELQVDAMSSQLESSPSAVQQQLERVRRQIQRDVCEARQSIWDLRSPALETGDLASALRKLGESFVGSNGVHFEFTASGKPSRCAHKIEEHLLRIGQEAVSNAVRHARARVVRVELRYEINSMILRVSDDGRGFDVEEAVPTGGSHWGLTTMHERAQAIGGHLRIVSHPGAGTNLEMIAPLLSSSEP